MKQGPRSVPSNQGVRQNAWRARGAGAGLIILLTVLAYLPALSGKFIWDDDSWTTGIPGLLRDFAGLQLMWCQPTALQQYYPLTGTTFWLDYHLWGFWPLPYHMENLLLHILSALLFWGLLRRLQVPGAWLAGALFALHPVMVESVAWITERKNVFSLVLYLGALLAYGRFSRFWQVENHSKAGTHNAPSRRWSAYALAFVLFMAALLSKATAFSLPAVILVICWWKRGRIRWQADVLPTLPFFAVAIGLCLGTAWLEKNHVGAKGPEWVISFPERCLIAGRALWFYTGKLLWPANLCFVYPRWQLDASSGWQWLYPVSAVGTLLILWQARGRIGRGPLAAALFFAGTLFPVLGFMNAYFMCYSFVCDHWVYLSSLGLVALAAALVVRAAEQLRAKTVLYGFSAVALSVLVFLTWRQCGTYADLETLWLETLTKNPGAWLAHNNLGNMLEKQGRIPEAVEHYEEALSIQPNSAEVHYNFGVALKQMGKIEEAIVQYEQALRLKPDYPEAHNNLALALWQGGQVQEAIAHWELALQIQPDSAEAHYNLAVALRQQGKTEDAIGHFEQALRFKPDFFEAHHNLALALWQTGRVQEAIAHWELALRIKPDYPEAQNDLAWLLATLGPAEGGDPVRAVALAERACDLTGHQVPGEVDTLAVAYAAAGRFNDAIATAEKAIDLARSAGQSQVVGEIQARLQLYRSGRAYSRSPDMTSPHNP